MRTLLCCVGLCLLLQGNAVSRLYAPGTKIEMPRPLTEEEIAVQREELKNPEKLKKFLMDTFDSDWENGYGGDFRFLRNRREPYDPQDETVKSVLLEICRESVLKTRWKYDAGRDAGRLLASLRQLGRFEDERIRGFLWGIAANGSKDECYRFAAIQGYLYGASAQDIKDFFVHFLENKGQFSPRLREGIVMMARHLFNPDSTAEEDRQRRDALFASLYVIAAQETDGRVFSNLAEFLIFSSKEYAESHQRVALSLKHSNPPNTPPKVIAKQWREALQRAGRPFTSINTNLTDLLSYDFSRPGEGEQDMKYVWMTPVPPLPDIGNSRKPHAVAEWKYMDAFPEKEVKRLREEFKDAGKLKEYLKKLLWSAIYGGEIAPLFKKKFDVSDEVMQTALTDIIRESPAKGEREVVIRYLREMAIEWLKEANKEADNLLAERSAEYADSPQRKAALERMNKPPEKPQ